MIICPVCGHQVGDRLAEICDNCGAELIVELGPVATDSPPAQGGPPEPANEEVTGANGAGTGDVPPPIPPTLPPGGDGGEPPPAEPGQSIPFEDRTLPFSTRFFYTIKQAFADPVALFSNVSDDGDIGPPVLFGVILGTFGTALGVLWQLMFGGFLAALSPIAPEEMALRTGMLVFALIFSPVLAAVGLFITAAIYHVMLLLLGDGRRGFSVTLRVMAYGGTPQLLGIVPFCGSIVGGIWSVVLFIVGAVYGHKTDWWRALIAYFLPIVVCCCLMFSFWTALMALFASVGP